MATSSWLSEFAQENPHLLQPGRYPRSFDQVAEHWAFNDRRSELLEELQTFIKALRSVVPVCAVWLSGSYFTSKELPSDIDATIVISDHLVDALSGSKRLLVTPQGIRRLAAHLDVRVDAYLLSWRCIPEPDAGNPIHSQYYFQRGYWDDWWMRLRSSVPDEGALPQRGYVEVILDGYSSGASD
ncbi:Uncharacterised protein [Mycobacteroides abscessus subsp. bolletii]|uniref:DUF6932 family protein n=1 Tax=Mycobacteroides abscessus TaxID=36809 RepID=UPI0009A78950|nr:hypothetical protein [Mycobacteroides abscessus]SKF67773.1 Uncharacterised protein [Mycobacteroides abscessus subsp. bolletii]SKF70580.1 Uncharacterised protein [Mycobacteroides abscessus subsp. bolletii]SPX82208.1 Uncharacterised protein [Mycobacteroides abscessus]